MEERIEKLRKNMKELNLQGMIVTNPLNIEYLTNIKAEGILLLTRKENIYITDSRYIEAVQSVITINDNILIYDSKNICEDDYKNFFLFCENVGFEEYYVTYADYKKFIRKYKINALVETGHLIEKQRMIKDKEEIEYIKQASKITDECFTYIQNFIKVGLTEKEIAEEIERFFKLNGAEGLAFDTIVASGENSSMPHAIPTNKKIEPGDVITIDFGCKYKGYCTDMTRTIFVEYIPENVKAIYNLVLNNQENALLQVAEGVKNTTLFKIVENNFKINGYNLLHALGHGVGMEVHEFPILSLVKDIPLKENMVIAIEPGIYNPRKLGIRIEDTILVTKNGYERLTNSTKDYVIVAKR